MNLHFTSNTIGRGACVPACPMKTIADRAQHVRAGAPLRVRPRRHRAFRAA